MLKIYGEFSLIFNWYVSPDNIAKVHSIFLNLYLRLHFTGKLHPIVTCYMYMPGIDHIFWGNIVPKSSPTNQFNQSLISFNSAKETRFWRFRVVVK